MTWRSLSSTTAAVSGAASRVEGRGARVRRRTWEPAEGEAGEGVARGRRRVVQFGLGRLQVGSHCNEVFEHVAQWVHAIDVAIDIAFEESEVVLGGAGLLLVAEAAAAGLGENGLGRGFGFAV